VDLEMDLDLAEAVASENVAATVDYADAAARLEELAQEGRFQLLETYVEEAASMLFEAYPPLEAVRIEAKKPGAVPAADFAAVRIERRREDV
jgi:dihydroneopterin aldolase